MLEAQTSRVNGSAGGEEGARGGAMRKRGGVLATPGLREAVGVRGTHERPHAAPEARAERGRRHRARLASGACEEDRFRHLIAEPVFDPALRSIDELAERGEIRARHRIRGRGNDLFAFLIELIEALEQIVRRERRGWSHGANCIADAIRGVR